MDNTQKKTFTYLSQDGRTGIHGIQWVPGGKIKAILQISHGMVEYIDRYDEFARYLAERGVLVTGNDHLGHGASVADKSKHGFFAEENGNRVLLKDIHRLRKMTEAEYPGIPYFLLGHSMGSFLARQYLCIYGQGLAGAVIMGTGCQPRTLAWFGMNITRVMAAVKGWEYRSAFVDSLAFGSYNRRFGEAKGKEWLSRNEENVSKYVKDELCTFLFTLNGYYNLFYSIYSLSFDKPLGKMPKDLPVFFVSGGEDPVGQFGEGPRKVYEKFLEQGMKNVSIKLYPRDRHEILNELDREQVYEDLYQYICRWTAE